LSAHVILGTEIPAGRMSVYVLAISLLRPEVDTVRRRPAAVRVATEVPRRRTRLIRDKPELRTTGEIQGVPRRTGMEANQLALNMFCHFNSCS
jgi:hypothetical protein